jgi:hypothetical protein
MWEDHEYVESACMVLLPNGHPSQFDPRTVTWQQVHREAQQFDGYDKPSDVTREVLKADAMDTVSVREVETGFCIEKDL